MANVVASLRVLLGLDAAEYVKGLTKAEYQAQKFARNTRSAILEVGKVLGGLKIADVFLENTKAIIAEASALNDLADATGSSVEALSRLNNQAKIAGTDFATMQSALLKLSQGMAGVDDESSKAKEALRILGITTKDPAQALQEIALAFDKYEDGVNKVGLAVALFGKQGASMVATLKDIAQLQDVGATISKKQAEEAEALGQAYRRLSVEAEGFKNLLLSSVVPAITDMIKEMSEGIKIAGGFAAALRLFGTLNPFDKPREGIQKLAAEIDELEKRRPGAGRFGPGELAEIDQMIADRRKQIEFLKVQERNAIKIDPSDTNVRDIIMGRKPPAPNPPGGGSTAKALRETTSETERLIQSLQKQVIAQQDLNQVDLIELEIAKLRKDAKSGLTAEGEAHLRILAQQVDADKEADRVAKELAKANKEAADEIQHRVDESRRANEEAQHEIDSIRSSVEATNLQILAITKGEGAVEEYNAAKREQLALEKEALAVQKEAEGEFGLAAKYRDAAAALRQLNASSKGLHVAEDLAKEAKAMQDVKDAISNTFADAFADIVTGAKSAKDAFRSLVDDITRQLARAAAQGVANKLFGGTQQGGPDYFGLIAKLAASYFGAGSGGGVSGVGFSGGGYGEHFAGGGVSRGGFAMVGEHGPEVVALPSGARVYSNAQSQGMHGKAVTINQTVNVMPGANTGSARQAAARLRDVTLDAVRDR